jgi:S1-C subfamily serine protease
MRPIAIALLVLALLVPAFLVPAASGAAPRAPAGGPRLDPRDISSLPSFAQRVEAALLSLRVTVPGQAPSAARLGTRRTGTAVVVDGRGYAVTVSYLLLDAVQIEARTRDGRTVRAEVAGIDFASGLGLIRLEDPGPWRPAPAGDSAGLASGVATGTVAVDDDNDVILVHGRLHSTQVFTGPWEYMLRRALIVLPAIPTWAGAAVVNDRGELVGVASLRLGDPPYVNLAIPVEEFLPVKEELIVAGRVTSRPPRPWLGLYTVAIEGGLVVSDFAPLGPAAGAGFQRGDLIVRVNGVPVTSQREFYEALWTRRAGEVIEVAVRRDDREHVIAVRSVDRHDVYRRRRP